MIRLLAVLLMGITLMGCGGASALFKDADTTQIAVSTNGFHLGVNPVTNTLEITAGTQTVHLWRGPNYVVAQDGNSTTLLQSSYVERDAETGVATIEAHDALSSCADFSGDVGADGEGGDVISTQGHGNGLAAQDRCRRFSDEADRNQLP